MQDSASINGVLRLSAHHDSAGIDIQKVVILAMRPGDPGMAYARTVLRQMEQSAVMADLSRAFSGYSLETIKPAP